MVRYICRSVGCASLLFLSGFTGAASNKGKNAHHCRIGTCYEVRLTSSVQRMLKTAFTDSASGGLTCRLCMREIRRGRFHKVAHLHGCSNSGIDRSKSKPFACKRCSFKADDPTIFYNHCRGQHGDVVKPHSKLIGGLYKTCYSERVQQLMKSNFEHLEGSRVRCSRCGDSSSAGPVWQASHLYACRNRLVSIEQDGYPFACCACSRGCLNISTMNSRCQRCRKTSLEEVRSGRDRNAKVEGYAVHCSERVQAVLSHGFVKSAVQEVMCFLCKEKMLDRKVLQLSHLYQCEHYDITVDSDGWPFTCSHCSRGFVQAKVAHNHCSDCHMSSGEQEGATEKKGVLSPGMGADSAEQASTSRAGIRYENSVEDDFEELDFEPTEFQQIAESLG